MNTYITNVHITLNGAIAALLAIVADKGYNHTATQNGGTGCVYGTVSENGFLTPVCIVGEYIARLGLLRALLTSEQYSEWEGACHATANETIWERLGAYGVTVDEDARVFLHSVQMEQDSPVEWGVAVTRGIERLQLDHQGKVDEARRALDDAQEREAALLNHTAALDALRPVPKYSDFN